MCTRLLEAWEICSSLPGSGEDGFKLRRPKFTVQVSWTCSYIPNGKAFATSQRSGLNPQGGVSWTVRVCSTGTIPWYKSLQQHYLWGGCCLQQLMARSSVLVKGGIFLLRCTSVFWTQKHTWIRNHGTCGTLKESGKRREENTFKRRLTHTLSLKYSAYAFSWRRRILQWLLWSQHPPGGVRLILTFTPVNL